MPTRFKSEDREKEGRQGMRPRQTGNFSLLVDVGTQFNFRSQAILSGLNNILGSQ